MDPNTKTERGARMDPDSGEKDKPVAARKPREEERPSRSKTDYRGTPVAASGALHACCCASLVKQELSRMTEAYAAL
jgi:hypothetical protein